MPQYLDIARWNRRGQFEFFKDFTEPFTGICTEVEVTTLAAASRAAGTSFFLDYLHKSLRAANAVEGFRYRIEGERVRVHERVDASATISREDGSFGFSNIEYDPVYEHFAANARAEQTRIAADYALFPPVLGDCVIHYSSVPWIHFSAVSHARHFAVADSSPKITFGRYTERKGRKWMPVAVHVHHALLDGRDIGRYLTYFQELLHEG